MPDNDTINDSESRAIQRVLAQYLGRLRTAIVRSPLLDASPGRIGRGQKLDVFHLNQYQPGAADEVVDALVSAIAPSGNPRNHRNGSIDLRPDFDVRSFELSDEQGDEVDREEIVDRIYRQADRYLVREASKIERETGNRCVWFGFPLLHFVERAEPHRSILAPLLLWPVRARLEPQVEKGLHIERDWESDGPLVNQIMSAWLKGRINLNLPVPGPDDVPRDRASMQSWISSILAGLDRLTVSDLGSPLQPVQRKSELDSARAPIVLNSAVLGIMRWPNQSLMTDLESLLAIQHFEEPFTDFFLGRSRVHDQQFSYDGEQDRHHVVSCDFSQEQAVLMARHGPGVLVHGPPGTGKSQTITNAIADEVARGGYVLVVCQKRAAIDVVAKNLDQAGLHDLYLLLHDATGDREATIRALKEQLDQLEQEDGHPVNQTVLRTRLCQRIEDEEARLEQLYSQFEAVQACGLTFKQIMAKLVGLAALTPPLRADSHLSDAVGSLTHEQVVELARLVERTGALYTRARPQENPWRYRHDGFTLTPASRRDIESMIGAAIEADRAHMDCLTNHGIGLEIDLDWDSFETKAKRLSKAIDDIIADPNAAQILDWCMLMHRDPATKATLEEIEKASAEVEKTSVDEQLDARLLKWDVGESTAIADRCASILTYRTNRVRWFSREYRLLRRQLRPLVLDAGLPWGWVDLRAMLELLQARLCRRRLREALDRIGWLGPGDSIATQLAAGRRVLEWTSRIHRVEAAVDQFPHAVAVLAVMRDADRDGTTAWRIQLDNLAIQCQSAHQVSLALDELRTVLQAQAIDPLVCDVRQGRSIEQPLERIRRGLASLDALREYERLTSDWKTQRNDSQILERLLQEHVPSGLESDGGRLEQHWSSVLWQSALETWRRQAVREHPDLEVAHGDTIEERREQLRELLAKKQALEPEAIRGELRAAQCKQSRSRHWRQQLRLRGHGAKRLREIIHEGLGLGLRWLRPCLLTNPNTASQILPLTQGMFDLVIFDEASQLPLEQAAPAIFRGKRIVVAGDGQQLPPTSFFRTRIDDEAADNGPSGDEEQDADAESGRVRPDLSGIDLALGSEDLLELSDSILPPHMLEVHYRSRHPALIEYSNWAHYQGRLHAAHPAWDGLYSKDAPIRVDHVQGVYHRKQNSAEAEHVVRLLQDIWSSTDPPTLGVVTFNQEQENAIEERIALKAEMDPTFRALRDREANRKDKHRDVGFFVKNLESVQGDERDVIVFSTTFGPTVRDRPETFRRTFGPLTQLGGERRLNVAVTRARQGIIVVSSMPFDRISDCLSGIEPGRTIKARDFLQVYMNYAQAVSHGNRDSIDLWLRSAASLGAASRHPSQHAGIRGFDSEFEEQVYDQLVRRGWSVDTQVGQAGFKIDLAIRHPAPEQGYILAVECDGASYHSGWNVRTRDVWRQAILEDYGWRFYRIWSTRWWTHREEVMDELHARLERRVHEVGGRAAVLPWGRTPSVEVDHSQDGQEETVQEVTRDRELRSDTTTNPQEINYCATSPTPKKMTLHRHEVNAWVEMLSRATADRAISDVDVADWRDSVGLQWALKIHRTRGRRFIQLTCQGDIVTQFTLDAPVADAKETSDLIEQLGSAQSHHDVIAWLGEFQLHLHPPDTL